MRIVLDGRKVGKRYAAYYLENRTCFTKRGLNKRIVLHALYHHLAYANDLDMTKKAEERAANSYAKDFLS